MKHRMGYRWHLRQRMADQGLFATTDLVPLLAERGVVLSREQVYRLVTGTPERLNLWVLAALCDILDATPGDLIEPVAQTQTQSQSRVGAGQPPAVARTPEELRPRRARIVPDDDATP